MQENTKMQENINRLYTDEIELLTKAAKNLGAIKIDHRVLDAQGDYLFYADFNDGRGLVPFYPLANNDDALMLFFIRTAAPRPDVNSMIEKANQLYQNPQQCAQYVRARLVAHYAALNVEPTPVTTTPPPSTNRNGKTLSRLMESNGLSVEKQFLLRVENQDLPNDSLSALFSFDATRETYLSHDFMVGRANWLRDDEKAKFFGGYALHALLNEARGTDNMIIQFSIPKRVNFRFDEGFEDNGRCLFDVSGKETKMFYATSFEQAVYEAVEWAKERFQSQASIA